MSRLLRAPHKHAPSPELFSDKRQASEQHQSLQLIMDRASERQSAQLMDLGLGNGRAISKEPGLTKTTGTSLHGSPTLQRKILLDPPEGPLAERNLGDLTKVIGGGVSRLILVKSNGELAMIGLDEADMPAGWRLLERMILSPHTVVLGYSGDIDGPKNKVDDLEDSRDPEKGSGSFVSVPEALDMQDLVKTAEDELIMEDTARHIILAHELIHADRAQRGYKGKGAAFHDVIGRWKQKDFSKKGVFATREELETVGLIVAAYDPDQITENMIRDQLNVKMRAAYDEKGLQLPE